MTHRTAVSTCTVCRHPAAKQIDERLVRGESYRSIARRYDLGFTSVGRHARGHLSPKLQKLHAEREENRAVSLLSRVERLISKLEGLADDAAETGKAGQMLATARELRESYRLLGRLTGELDERPQVVNVLVSPEWQRVRAELVAALAPFPEARVAVSQRLLELGMGETASRPSELPVIEGTPAGRLL